MDWKRRVVKSVLSGSLPSRSDNGQAPAALRARGLQIRSLSFVFRFHVWIRKQAALEFFEVAHRGASFSLSKAILMARGGVLSAFFTNTCSTCSRCPVSAMYKARAMPSRPVMRISDARCRPAGSKSKRGNAKRAEWSAAWGAADGKKPATQRTMRARNMCRRPRSGGWCR